MELSLNLVYLIDPQFSHPGPGEGRALGATVCPEAWDQVGPSLGDVCRGLGGGVTSAAGAEAAEGPTHWDAVTGLSQPSVWPAGSAKPLALLSVCRLRGLSSVRWNALCRGPGKLSTGIRYMQTF